MKNYLNVFIEKIPVRWFSHIDGEPVCNERLFVLVQRQISNKTTVIEELYVGDIFL